MVTAEPERDKHAPSTYRVQMTLDEYQKLRRSVVHYQHYLIERARAMSGKVLPAQAEEARAYKAEAVELLDIVLRIDTAAFNKC